MCLCSSFFHILCVFLGGSEEYRRRGSSRDAQGHFRRPSKWGRDGQSYGGGWRGAHLPGEKHYRQQSTVYVYSRCASSLVCWRLVSIVLIWVTSLFDYLWTVIKDYNLPVCLSCSVPTVFLATGWTHSPPSPLMLRPHRWPTSGPSSSLRVSLSLHQTPLPWCPLLNFSPQTLTTMPLQSE